jgi:hypothetical protein
MTVSLQMAPIRSRREAGAIEAALRVRSASGLT